MKFNWKSSFQTKIRPYQFEFAFLQLKATRSLNIHRIPECLKSFETDDYSRQESTKFKLILLLEKLHCEIHKLRTGCAGGLAVNFMNSTKSWRDYVDACRDTEMKLCVFNPRKDSKSRAIRKPLYCVTFYVLRSQA